jgi:hypothetical protein
LRNPRDPIAHAPSEAGCDAICNGGHDLVERVKADEASGVVPA